MRRAHPRATTIAKKAHSHGHDGDDGPVAQPCGTRSFHRGRDDRRFGRALREIGIEPESTESFDLADGRPVRREIGNVLYEIEGCTRAAPVVFGRKGDACLLGVVTLEALGLRLDPLRRQLKPLKLMIA